MIALKIIGAIVAGLAVIVIIVRALARPPTSEAIERYRNSHDWG